MSDQSASAALTALFGAYARALESYDAATTAAHYGFPCMMLTDSFVGSLNSAGELVTGLTQAYEYYRQFDLARVAFTIISSESVTDRIVRVRIRWVFYDSKGEFLVDSDYEYVLREENNAFKIYIAISINEEQKIQELMSRKRP